MSQCAYRPVQLIGTETLAYGRRSMLSTSRWQDAICGGHLESKGKRSRALSGWSRTLLTPRRDHGATAVSAISVGAGETAARLSSRRGRPDRAVEVCMADASVLSTPLADMC